MVILRVTWRNLWRNGQRTAVSIAAMSTGTAVLIVISSLIAGLIDQLVTRITRQGVGEVQVHAPAYLARRSLHETVAQPEAILQAARAQGIAAAPRAIGFGLLAQGPKSAGAQLMGVDADAELAVGDLPTRLAEGQFLPKGRAKQVVLGRRLARSLDARLGSELVVVVQAADGSTSSGLFHVGGILQTLSEPIDRSGAYISREDFGELFSFPGQVHEISLSSRGQLTSEAVAAAVTPAAGKNEVKTWRRLLPNLGTVVDLWNAVSGIMGAIFFLAAGLGVLNTLLMASYERIPEFGLIKALGATPGRIIRDVVAEALMLGLVSTALGAVVGIAMAFYAQARGLDISLFAGSVSFSGVAMDSTWKAKVTPLTLLQPILTMLTMSVLSALYPAIKAARLDPIRALVHV